MKLRIYGSAYIRDTQARSSIKEKEDHGTGETLRRLARAEGRGRANCDTRDGSAKAAARKSEGQGSKPIALTLKVDQARYEALKVLGARTRRSNQEILLAALDAYLEGEQIP